MGPGCLVMCVPLLVDEKLFQWILGGGKRNDFFFLKYCCLLTTACQPAAVETGWEGL
jgi:hypothetical protein